MTDSANRKFANLTGALDGIIKEAASEIDIRALSSEDRTFDQNKARSRAYIHLYLKVAHAIVSPRERESHITEGPGDGGLDAFYIDHVTRQIYLIQSKFRIDAEGFEQKYIHPHELTKLHLDAILLGKSHTDDGERLNGRVSAFQRQIAGIASVATYKYVLVFLANVSRDTASLIEKIFDRYEVEIYNFERTYASLLFPYLISESYYGPELTISFSTSEKALAPRLSADIATRYGPCNLAVFLVPIGEIAATMLQYKNAILRYNPRSYLEFANQGTNIRIKESIEQDNKGEFALLNNGITMIVEKCSFTDRMAVPDQASITLTNPQIINGGQTAYTLATAWEAMTDRDRRNQAFGNKEVVLRIISVENIPEKDRPELITSISVATNTQTAVTHADRKSNTELHRQISARLFELTGLMYEYKTGEFFAALRAEIVNSENIIDRNTFHRLIYIANEDYYVAIRRNLMSKGRSLLEEFPSDEALLEVPRLLSLFRRIMKGYPDSSRVTLREAAEDCIIAEGLRLAASEESIDLGVDELTTLSRRRWGSFLKFARQVSSRDHLDLSAGERATLDKKEARKVDHSTWITSPAFKEDLIRYCRKLIKDPRPVVPDKSRVGTLTAALIEAGLVSGEAP